MTDKVQKIREEIEKIKTVHSSINLKDSKPDILAVQICINLLSFIDSLQEELVSEKKCMFTKDSYTDEERKVLCEDCKEKCEYSKKEEPVSEVWYNAKKTLPESSTKQIICIKEDGLSVATVGKIVTGTIKWAYLDTLLHISNKNLTESQCRKLIDTAFELGKAANKDKPVSEEQVKESTKNQHVDKTCKENGNSLTQEPVSEVLEEAAFDYAESCKYDGGEKLLCVEHFKAGAKWQKEQMTAKAFDGEILEVEDNDCAICSHTHLELCIEPDTLEKNGFKDNDKVKVIVIK